MTLFHTLIHFEILFFSAKSRTVASPNPRFLRALLRLHSWPCSVSYCLWPYQQPPSFMLQVLSTYEFVSCFCLRHVRKVKLQWLKYLLTALEAVRITTLPLLSSTLFLFSFLATACLLPQESGEERTTLDKLLRQHWRGEPIHHQIRITFEIFSKLIFSPEAPKQQSQSPQIRFGRGHCFRQNSSYMPPKIKTKMESLMSKLHATQPIQACKEMTAK